MRTVIDSLFPKMHVKTWGYGNAVRGFSRAGATVGVVNLKEIRTDNGESKWHDFIHLPSLHPTSKAIPPVDWALEELIQKTQDAQNYDHRVTITGTETSIRRYDQPVAYLGGSYEHYFQNTSTVPCSLQIIVSKPRQYLRDCLQSTESVLPTQLSMRDKQLNEIWREGATHVIPSGGVNVDSDLDPMFNFSKHDRGLHHNWIVGKAHNFTLAPSESVTFTIQCPPFQFDESTWKSQVAVDFSSGAAGNLLPTHMPFCTQVMSVRLSGSLVHPSADPGSYADYGQVGYSMAHVIHTVKSFHSLRSIPPQVPNQVVFVNNMDRLRGALDINIGTSTINPDTNDTMTVDDA
jgi:hypothetical protein